MQRHRFHAQPARFTVSTVTLDSDESHHLLRVLRLSQGARAFVFDGEGSEWECEVARVGKNSVDLDLIRKLDESVESPLQLTLAQALIKSDKFDWIVQKTTELGVSRIVPLITDHSDIRRAENRADQKLQRWRRIALEAVKQSGRRRLVEIAEPIPFAQYNDADPLKLILSERGGKRLDEIAPDKVSSISIAIGPEGGWSEDELEASRQHEFIPIHLGRRILRTETAAIAAVTLAQYIFGDIKGH